MTEKRSQTAQPRPNGEQPLGQEQPAQAVNRRAMFGVGFAGLASAILQACSSSDFASGSAGGRQKGDAQKMGKNPEGGGGDDGSDGAGDGGQIEMEPETPTEGEEEEDEEPEVTDEEDKCLANTTNKIDLKKIPQAEADEKPVVRFYGRNDHSSLLIAMKFPAGKEITEVIITRDDGKLVALHGITGADKNAQGFRPIVVDGVNLKGATKIQIVIQSGNQRKRHEEPIALFKTFQGLAVVDLANQTVPANMFANQSVTCFAEGPVFNDDPNVKYPDANGNENIRGLKTVKMGSTWTRATAGAGNGVKGTVTDIMGEVIPNIGGGAIIEYQVFCTYVEANGQMYRTMLHIG